MKEETIVGPFRVYRREVPRRSGGADIFYDVIYTAQPDSDPTAGTIIAAVAPAADVLQKLRDIIMDAAEVHRVIRDKEDPS